MCTSEVLQWTSLAMCIDSFGDLFDLGFQPSQL